MKLRGGNDSTEANGESFEVTLGQNKFQNTEKIQIFKKYFWPLDVDTVKFRWK